MRSGVGPFSRTSTATVCRLGALLGPLLFGHADPNRWWRSRRPSRGYDIRRADGERGRPRRRDRRRGAVGRDGAARLVRHRSGDERLRLARGHRRDRLIKFAGNYHGHVDALLASARLGSDDARDPVDAGRPVGGRCRHHRPAVQRRRRRSPRRGRVRRGARRDPRRARRRQHGRRPAGPRLPRGPPDAVRRKRRAAGLRRGDHRLPGSPRRRPGALRRAARPDDPRQDRRRWPACGSVRRPCRADASAGSRRRRLPAGNALGEPPRDRRRHLGSAPAAFFSTAIRRRS